MSRTFYLDENGKQQFYIHCDDTNEEFDSANWPDPKLAYNCGYISSIHWSTLRNNYISSHGDICEECDNAKGYAVMHISRNAFNNLGSENDNDLIYLCKKCSTKHHEDLLYPNTH